MKDFLVNDMMTHMSTEETTGSVTAAIKALEIVGEILLSLFFSQIHDI